MFSKLEKLQCRIKVTSKLGEKYITADLNSYIKVTRYENIIDYLKRNKRELARAWGKESKNPIMVSEIFHDEKLYEEFIQLFVLKEFTLKFDNLFAPFYSVKTHKDNTCTALFSVSDYEEVNQINLIQAVLNQYGYIGSIPKYELISILELPYQAIV